MSNRSAAGHLSTAVVPVLACGLLLAACGGGGSASDEGEGGDAVTMTVEPSAVPAFVASDRDLFEGIDVEVTEVGYDQVESLLVSGETEVAWISPLETAQFVAEGQPFRYFSTAGAQNMYNGVVVRAEDSNDYQSLQDLTGSRLGIPGFGTGTWTAFSVFAQTFYGIDNPRNAFDIVTADSGALLALLERGEIDAALLFSGSSAAARSGKQFHTVFSFTEAMQEETGQPLTVNGSVARADWVKKNPQKAASIVAGLDAAVKWMQNNPQAFEEDGTYADLAENAGWHSTPETTAGVLELIKSGQWYLSGETYTDEWIDSVYQLVETGKGSLVEEVPAKDDVFMSLDDISGASRTD